MAQVVEQWTGIPVQSMLETESEKLLRMEEVINERVIGRRKRWRHWPMPFAAPAAA